MVGGGVGNTVDGIRRRRVARGGSDGGSPGQW